MFGNNKPQDVGLIKNDQGSFGLCLRGSYPPFVIRVQENSVAKTNVRVSLMSARPDWNGSVGCFCARRALTALFSLCRAGDQPRGSHPGSQSDGHTEYAAQGGYRADPAVGGGRHADRPLQGALLNAACQQQHTQWFDCLPLVPVAYVSMSICPAWSKYP